jgi:crotonobetainyl-CoA:carnitine CoA-transferase CaiB-like acyl-CoA transferase
MQLSEPTRRHGPCSGFTVLEVATTVAGPFVGQILGDLGANVIKFEGIDGDVVRTVPQIHEGFSGAFEQWNRNKRSIAVDLKSADGLALLRTLALSVDVLVENFRPGVASALGIGYDALKRENPKLVYLSINGFGDDGPYVRQPAYDTVMQGLTGFMPLQGSKADPKAIRSCVVDKIAGISGAMSVIAALLHREVNSGQGQKVNVKMLDAYAAFILPEHFYAHTFEYESPPVMAPLFPYITLPTSNGHAVGGVANDAALQALCLALGRPDITQPAQSGQDDFEISSDIIDQLKLSAAAYSTEALIAILLAHGLEFFRVNSLEEFLADPQVLHNQSYVAFDDPELGTVRHLNSFARFAQTPDSARHRTPRLSEHADEILREFDIPEATIASYRARGIIR